MKQVTRNGYHDQTAIFLAAMCYQTYPFFFSQKLVLPKGYKLLSVIRGFANVENPAELELGYMAESRDRIVIAFRGYASYPADLLASYDILQIPYGFVKNAGKTSRGFTCVYRSARLSIFRHLMKVAGAKRLFITGHNYGGALATLAALDIAVNTKYRNPAVYTYGSPRVGDPRFASRFNETIAHSARIVNIHDSFPTFPSRVYPPPFTRKGIAYRHVRTKHSLSFQLNNTPRNDAIACYFKALSQKNPEYTRILCAENPDFCPTTDLCIPYVDKELLP
ncbi:lipase family protein [Paenibacillus sp. HB172176]|uniref:lipase family protein n=1 Tax=Paenibacillus sp. HB172176 TaxID=2493690 RepID=UPI001F102149|nr:lipase family protein [Paenibacillus sp. HB172176]